MIFISFQKLSAMILLIFFSLFLFVWTPFSHMLVHMILFFRVLELTHILSSFSLYLTPSPPLPHSFSFLFFPSQCFSSQLFGYFLLSSRFGVFFFLSIQIYCWKYGEFLGFLLCFSVGRWSWYFFIIHSCFSCSHLILWV